jgi:hypothetical protein
MASLVDRWAGIKLSIYTTRRKEIKYFYSNTFFKCYKKGVKDKFI